MVALVLLPGMDGTGELFSGFLEALGSEVDASVVSYPPAQVLDYSQLEAFVRYRLPSDGSFVLLGESFSGPIAVSIASSPPHGLRGLVLCCSFVKNPRPGFGALKGLVDFLPVRALPVAFLSRMLLGRFSSPPIRNSLRRVLAQVSQKVLRGRIRAVLGVNVTSALSQVRVPVLYLRASEDRVVARAAFGLISKLLRGQWSSNWKRHIFCSKSPLARPRDTSVVSCGR
jgi:pimeloyl-[acyl-carrier protein] methyl ester esterase